LWSIRLKKQHRDDGDRAERCENERSERHTYGCGRASRRFVVVMSAARPPSGGLGVVHRILDIEGLEEIVEPTREVFLSRHERMVQAVVQDSATAS
jgi:hypothetical protein